MFQLCEIVVRVIHGKRGERSTFSRNGSEVRACGEVANFKARVNESLTLIPMVRIIGVSDLRLEG